MAKGASLFRPEIAGLRAVAVVAVILFHLKVSAFRGGFVGVDVFFVISGYLITRNILGALGKGGFSFLDFYLRRTRRIFPALAVTVAATWVMAALWCSAPLFQDIAKESTHALLSIANIQYWRESQQYFAPSSDELALLHVWSLSAEEQFYLVWPALLVGIWRTGRPFLWISIVGAASFVAAVYVSTVNPSAVFFLMPFRMFEFAIGALGILAERRCPLAGGTKNVVSAAGLIAIGASAVMLRSDVLIAPPLLLLPCLGTAAVIWAGIAPATGWLLASRSALWIGAISYSLYLCHWPVIFFARFLFGEAADARFAIIAVGCVMLALAWLLHRLVERPFLDSPPQVRWKSYRNFSALTVCLVAITHGTFVMKGIPWRISGAQAEATQRQSLVPSNCSADRHCPIGFPNGPVALEVVGDSYAIQYLAGLDRLLAGLQIAAVTSTLPGCPLLEGVLLKGANREECRKWRDEALIHLKSNDHPIFLSQAWENYTPDKVDFDDSGSLQSSIERTLRTLHQPGRQIMIVTAQVRSTCAFQRARLLPGPLPHADVPPCAPRDRAEVMRSNADIDRMFEAIQSVQPGDVRLFRPEKYLCPALECATMQGTNWLYYDAGHFNVTGSLYVMERAADDVAAMLRR